MKKKKPAKLSAGARAAKEAQDAARKLGELQKQIREQQRKLGKAIKKAGTAAKKEEQQAKLELKRGGKARDTYGTREPTTLFVGGRKENSKSENADDPFTAEDLLLNRKAVTDKVAGLALYHTKGKKKGAVKFRAWTGGWKSANERKLAKYKGKEITLVVTYEKNKQGRTTTHEVRRKVKYKDYRSLVAAYRDAFRQDVIDADSDASYGVQFITYEPPPIPAKKPKRKKRKAPAKKTRKAGKRKATKRTKKKKRSRSPANNAKRKPTARRKLARSK
jgi:hypothetical protein